MVDLMYIVLALCALVVVYILKEIFNSGFFSKIEPMVTESPKYLSTPLTVYYKYHLGPYSNTGAIVSEVKDIVPSGATTFGIFYDNPDAVPAHLMQSAVGVVFGDDGKDLYSDNYAQQLTRCGFEKMILPKLPRAVQATQPNRGRLAIFALIFRTYGIVKSYIESNRLDARTAIEFYGESEYCLLFPLDHTDEYVVPEVKSLDELESDLAKKKFDSDESDSESEAEEGEGEEAEHSATEQDKQGEAEEDEQEEHKKDE